MPDRTLPEFPNLDQYKKQAKELLRECRNSLPEALARLHAHHPDRARASLSLTAAQLVIAREHGFESWPKYAAQIESLRVQRAVASLSDPLKAFLVAATVPRDGSSHTSGTLDEAEAILARYPQVGHANIYTAAVMADESAVRAFLLADPKLAATPGGPYEWDALTHLCFSRYLRIDRGRSDAFVKTARILLDAGASPNTGWDATWQGQREFESVIYGAAGAAQHPGLTRLLLEYGADPNDGETCYHAPESYDNTVTQILLESGKFNDRSRTWILVRKADWHDYEGIKLALDNGADPNAIPQWGNSALQHAIQRDNRIEIIRLLIERGADPLLSNGRDGRSAAVMAARRGAAMCSVFFATAMLICSSLESTRSLLLARSRTRPPFNPSSKNCQACLRNCSSKEVRCSLSLLEWATAKASVASWTSASLSMRFTAATVTSTSPGTPPLCMGRLGVGGPRPRNFYWSAAPQLMRSMEEAARRFNSLYAHVPIPIGRIDARLIGSRLCLRPVQPSTTLKSPVATMLRTN